MLSLKNLNKKLFKFIFHVKYAFSYVYIIHHAYDSTYVAILLYIHTCNYCILASFQKMLMLNVNVN